MAKPKPLEVPSDDYVVTVDGVEYHTHEGEHVSIRSVLPVADLQTILRFSALGESLRASAADESSSEQEKQEAIIRGNAILDEHYAKVCEVVARGVLEWNWTDDDGKPLPQPHNNPAVIATLSSEEMYYLLRVLRNGGNQVQEGNAGAVSLTTS